MRKPTLTLLASLLFVSTAVADTVVVGNLELRDVSVQGIEADQLVFRSSAGRETSRPIAEVARLELDGQRAFNDAEAAFATGAYDQAVGGYLTTVKGGAPDWLKNYAARKLMAAATQADRFDDAATAYATLATVDPEAAVALRPRVPEKPGQVAAAAAEIEAALRRRPSEAARQALLSFQLDLERARGDTAAATRIVEELQQAARAGTGDAGAPTMSDTQAADLALAEAGLALDAGEAARVPAVIDAAAASFVEPRQQAEALYLKAQAAEAVADTPEARQDAAIAYLTVVAHFKESPDAPRVAESMRRAAALLQELGKTVEAQALLDEVGQRFPDAR